MKARFLKSKYQSWVLLSSSIRPDISDWYDVILEHTFWTVGNVIILISRMISGALRNASLCLQVFLMPKGLN